MQKIQVQNPTEVFRVNPNPNPKLEEPTVQCISDSDSPRYSRPPSLKRNLPPENDYDYVGPMPVSYPFPFKKVDSSKSKMSDRTPSRLQSELEAQLPRSSSTGKCGNRYYLRLSICNVLLLIILCSAFMVLWNHFHPPIKQCPEFWKFFRKTGCCYKFFDMQSNFNQAETYCGELDSHLVSIHNEAENTFVADLSRQDQTLHENTDILGSNQEIWIGLVYADDKWQWEDGTSARYTNWAAQEPNRLATETKTTLITSKILHYNPNGTLWNNIGEGSSQRGFVCKKEGK